MRPEPVPRTRVVVQCDDALTVAGLGVLLRDCPDLVLVPQHDRGAAPDIRLVVVDRLEHARLAAPELTSARARTRRVLVVTDLEPDDFAVARAAGVVGVLRRREVTRGTLVALLRAAATAQVTPPHPGTPRDPVTRALRSVDRPDPTPPTPGGVELAEREVEVLRMLAEGCDTREIAHRLCYSERTVKTVIQDITRRFGLRNRSHAVAYAVRHGLA